ncbi:hypothetical protein QTG54_015476 [Skeletonema marinoi]|uniref:Uncharacterized protein n=1 Tax=Skeletonema marinoi TaxID=267567 RepID=A0AAD9D5P7_9STRA|nr:hypothetical protein QTG54_015476 [Skeletonema marinoi]
MANNGRSSPLLQLFARSPSDGAATEDKNGSSSTLMRSLSKCFEPPLDEAIIDENGIGVTASKAVKEQQQWGPSISISDSEDEQNKKPPMSPGFAGTQLFKPSKQTPESKSRSSHHANNSNHTHPTDPTTVGANSQSTTANTNAAKAAAANGSFWNFNARAADSSDSLHASSSTLSNPAKAAADAASAVMMGMLSRANEFMTTSSSSSGSQNNHHHRGAVTPSPPKKNAMEGIPEDRACGGDIWGGFCADNDNACFTDFGFNPFSGDDDDAAVVGGVGGNNTLSTPPKGGLSPSSSAMRKQHEILLSPDEDEKDGAEDADEDIQSKLGFGFIELPAPDIERSVSELTMRSIGAHARDSKPLDSRRMAYYAVGRAGDGKSSGNRRCYFTGTSIPYATPFYAGCVQQGPRTLVVFCLPSALGLRTLSANSQTKEERERYLQSLPNPDVQLLKEMKKRYAEPFDTLPSQVRSPVCWQLFVKFCFFSGLPIAEGEMHYRVKSTVNVIATSPADSTSIPEEISLSHEVMETVNGKVSAEILRLPNQKTFDYIRTQYSQQSAKLNAEVFDRKSWEMVMPEV